MIQPAVAPVLSRPARVLPTAPAADGFLDGRSQAPDLAHLDFLGRLPIPLRRPFKAGLDRRLTAHQAETGTRLDCCFLTGAEWYRPFDELAAASATERVPGMLLSSLDHDLLDPSLLPHYAPNEPHAPQPACHPAATFGRLQDPLGVFNVFAVVPFVFLVDETRLKGRPAPQVWSDLLDPMWADDIVFGGWRPNDRVPYQDYNRYLLLCLAQRFGLASLERFAGNVRHLQHNIRTATQAGSNSAQVGAIAVLPWLQALLCPRRERTRVIWPKDGALALPIFYLIQAEAEDRLRPVVDYLNSGDWGRVLARNGYPPLNPAVPDAFPPGARLTWPGWAWCRSHDLALEEERASRVFFDAWYARHAVRACS